MLSYILKRILSLLPVLFVVSVVIFLVVYLIPGGPATAMLGLEASAEQIAELNAQLGFDRPFLVQYVDWLAGVFHGDWGQSYFLDMPVLTAIAEYFGPTLSLAILAQVLSLIFAIPMGMLAAYKRGTAVDLATVSISLLGTAVPGFLLSMFLMLFFGVYLRWLPVAGYAPLEQGLWEHLRYLIQRLMSGQQVDDQGVSLLGQMRREYPQIYVCARAVVNYFAETWKWQCNDEELLYLMLHIYRVQQKGE